MSFAELDTKNMELTPVRVKWKPPGGSTYVDLGGTLDNVVISIAYKKSEIKADQSGTSVRDRRVSGIDIKVTTSLAEIKNKEIIKVLFPHATMVENILTVDISAASPGVVTETAHGVVNGDKVKFTAGTLPTGLSLNTIYYAVNSAANTFELSLTRGGASINTTGSAATGVTMVRVGKGAVDFIAAIGDSDQANAGELLLHPLSLADADESGDFLAYKACSSAESEMAYGPEGQVKAKIVWQILPDESVTPDRYMRYGDKDLV